VVDWKVRQVGSRALAAEFVGTALLLTAVVGSGIMGERLANGNIAIALRANTLATGAALVALMLTFGPISGAHFNPVVALAASQGGLRFTAACWFTASTSFANPAVTLAAIVDEHAGIRPVDVPGFVVAQTVGATAATALFRWRVLALPAVADRVVVPHDRT
jgi:glycerol uptake facilitator-like aquaporin